MLTVFGAARNTLHLVQCELLFLVFFFFFFPHLVVSTRLLSAFQGVFMCSLATRLNLTAFFFCLSQSEDAAKAVRKRRGYPVLLLLDCLALRSVSFPFFCPLYFLIDPIIIIKELVALMSSSSSCAIQLNTPIRAHTP